MLWVLAFALALDLNGLELCSRLGPQKFLNFTFVLCLILWEFFYCMAFVNALVLDLIGLELCSRLGPHFFEHYLRFGPVLSWISDVFSHLFFALF